MVESKSYKQQNNQRIGTLRIQKYTKIHRICTTLSVRENYADEVIIIVCQFSFMIDIKGTRVCDMYNGEIKECGGQSKFGKTLYLRLNIVEKYKLPLKRNFSQYYCYFYFGVIVSGGQDLFLVLQISLMHISLMAELMGLYRVLVFN